MSANNDVTRGPALAWYLEKDGIRIIPIGANKKARASGFGKSAPDFTVRSVDFRNDDWVAICCGPQARAAHTHQGYNHLLCIDIDGTPPAGLWEQELGAPLPPTLTSKDQHHWWYWISDEMAPKLQQWRRLIIWQGGAVDLCWSGGYAIERGQWDARLDGSEGRWDISAIAPLPDALVAKLVALGRGSEPLPDLPAALAALARWWPKRRADGGNGGCHDAALALGGILASNGVGEEAARSALEAAGGGGFWALTGTDDRTADVIASIEAHGRGVNKFGWPKLLTLLSGPERAVAAAVRRVQEYLRKLRPAAVIDPSLLLPGNVAGNAGPADGAATPEPTAPVAGDYIHVASWPPHQQQAAIIDILSRRDTAYALGEALVEIDAGDTAARMLTVDGLQRVIGLGPEKCWRLTKEGLPYKIGCPPVDVCSPIVSMRRAPEWWAARGVRNLVGVSHCPFVARDGQVVQQSGYHADSGWYLIAGSLGALDVPEAPTHAQAQAALAELLLPWSDFPWVSAESMMVPVAALLAALARPAIAGPVPLHVMNAPTPGSGKTLAADLVGRVVTGAGLRPLTWPTSEEERGKTLSAIAISGARPFVLIDNVGRGRVLGGDALERVITASDGVEFRILGRSEAVVAPWTSVVMATGNGVSVPDDMVRRTLMARLEPDSRGRSDTKDREWACGPDVRVWVLERRAALLTAALTVLRAHVVAGRPAGPTVLKGFESWSSVVAHALWWASGADVCAAAPDAADDETGGALDALVRCLPLGKENAVDFRRLQDMGRESGGDGAGLALRVAVQEFATAVGLQATSLSELTAVQWGRLMGGWVGDPRPTGTLRRAKTKNGAIWWRDPPPAM